MFSDKIVLDFEIEKGDRIDRCYFSTRIKLTDKSKSFLREKIGKPNNLDDYINLNPENFYIYYNKYSGYYGINELYVRVDNGDRCYFSTRVKLTDKSKSFLREKLGKPNNLDDYINLNPETFYIYYNKNSGHYGINELFVRDYNGRYVATKLPLDQSGFSIELSFDQVNYGFYSMYATYNPTQYDKKQEKSFEDNSELQPFVSSVLYYFLYG